jgi:hypothetical protein
MDWRGAKQTARSDGRSDSGAPQSPTRRRRDAPKNRGGKQYLKPNSTSSRVCLTLFSD